MYEDNVQYITIEVKKDDYKSLMKNVLRTFRKFNINVRVEEK